MLIVQLTVVVQALVQAPVLRFTDCKSGREVVLVGVMHNNPTSIRLVEGIIDEYAANGALGVVAVESCEARWSNSQKYLPSGSALRTLFNNEFQAAADRAEEVDCGVALADQAIDVTCGRLAQLAKQTVVELANPFDGGWQLVGRDIGTGWAALKIDEGGEGVDVAAFVSPELLAGAPVAWLRYFFGSPLLAALLASTTALLSAAVSVGEPPGAGMSMFEWVEFWAPSVLLSVVESVLLLRVSLVGLIEERN